jgi:asparagine synthase (glutamine-hydrolysing)
MFAFAIFDERNRRLLLARDRIGKKPLHYALSGDQLLFGSEIKAILAVAPGLATVDEEAILQYFYFGYIPDPKTAFSEIHKLPPGHILEFEHGVIRTRQYWDLPPYGTHSPATEQECLEELEAKLDEAVRIRMIADVPLGALLSGGTDSSTVVALMARASSRPVKTFSIGFRHRDFDETPYARQVAESLGTEHHELILDPDVVQTVQSLGQSMEEPFGDSSMLPTFMVSRLARKYVTVVLSGDGGDESFAGYDRYQIQLGRSLRWLPAWAGRLYRERVYPHLPFGVPGRNFAYSVSLPCSERYIEAVSLAPTQRDCGLLSPEFVASFNGHSDPLNRFRDYIAAAPSQDPLSYILYLDNKTYLPGDILTKVDRMTMAASLEARAPMLDHVFLEWVTSLSNKWKVRAGTQKYILLKLAEKLGVPRTALYRPKRGFTLPLVHWMRGELKEMIVSFLLDKKTLERGYFNAPVVRRLLQEFFEGRADDHLPIWRLFIFELWQRNFLEPLTQRHALPELDSVA